MKGGLICSTLILDFFFLKQHVFACEQTHHLCLRCRCISQRTQGHIFIFSLWRAGELSFLTEKQEKWPHIQQHLCKKKCLTKILMLETKLST